VAWGVRPAGLADLPGLHSWLPPGAARDLPAGDDELWLVAQRGDPADGPGEALAAVRLRQAIGLDRPRHWYHVGCVVHAAAQLNLFQRRDILLLGNDHTGASELADLCCDAAGLGESQQALLLRLLLRAALLVAASRRRAFTTRLIAELPGQRNDSGASPFWQGLGRHFYGGDPALAEARFGAAWRSHLAPLLPRQPVYTAFLPESARAAIAQAGAASRLAADALMETGLAYAHHVRIDDAGPVLEADLDRLLAALAPRRCQVQIDSPAAAGDAGPDATDDEGASHRRAATAAGRRWLLLREDQGGPVVTLHSGRCSARRAPGGHPSSATSGAWALDLGA